MAGIALKTGLDDKAFQALLAGLRSLNHGGLRSALKAIGNAVHTAAVEAFEEERAPGGAPWQESERAKIQGGQTLSDTGRLKSSLSVSAGATHVEVGSNAVYAAIHQLGGQAGRGHKLTLPARPFLPDEDNMPLDLGQEMLDIVAKRIRRAVG